MIFFNDYFSKSSLFNHNHFSSEDREIIKNTALPGYTLFYLNSIYRPKAISKNEASILFNMLKDVNWENVSKYFFSVILTFSKHDKANSENKEIEIFKKMLLENIEKLNQIIHK